MIQCFPQRSGIPARRSLRSKDGKRYNPRSDAGCRGGDFIGQDAEIPSAPQAQGDQGECVRTAERMIRNHHERARPDKRRRHFRSFGLQTKALQQRLFWPLGPRRVLKNLPRPRDAETSFEQVSDRSPPAVTGKRGEQGGSVQKLDCPTNGIPIGQSTLVLQQIADFGEQLHLSGHRGDDLFLWHRLLGHAFGGVVSLNDNEQREADDDEADE